MAEEHRLGKRLDEIRSVRQRDLLLIFLSVAVGLASRAIALYFFHRRVVRRVRQLTENARSLRGGADLVHEPSDHPDDIGERAGVGADRGLSGGATDQPVSGVRHAKHYPYPFMATQMAHAKEAREWASPRVHLISPAHPAVRLVGLPPADIPPIGRLRRVGVIVPHAGGQRVPPRNTSSPHYIP